jgi:hypothetical protein
MEYGEHRFVSRQDPGEKVFNTPLLGYFGDIIQKISTHAFLLPFIVDDEGDFSRLCFGVKEILRHCDKVFVA